jgi:PAS domain S-box-containing protein
MSEKSKTPDIEKLVAEVKGLRAENAALKTVLARDRSSSDENLKRLMMLEAAILAFPVGFQLFDGDDRLVINNNRMILFDDTGTRDQIGVKYDDYMRFGVEVGNYPEAEGRTEEFIAERLGIHHNPSDKAVFRRGDGRSILIEKRILEDGSVVGAFTNVTELVETQTLLSEAEANYQRIFERVGEGIFRTSRDGRLLQANPALVELNGYETEEELLAAINDIAMEWYVEPDRRDEFIRIIEEHGSVENFESEVYRHKTREEIWVSENAYLVCDEAGQPLYFDGTVRDITARKQAEIENNRLLHEAQTANLAKSQFLANMSHDLRTPLNSILGFSELMEDGIFGALGDKRYDEYVNIVSKSGRYLLSLIDDILDVSRIERGEYVINPVAIDFQKLIETIIVRLTSLDNGISPDRFIVAVSADAPVLLADERAITQILDNVISNAVKYSKNDGAINITWGLDGGGRKRLSVQDEGFGIPADLLQYVMEPFTQGTARDDPNPLIARTGTGVGLGLHIVSLLAKLHGAEVEIDSKVDAGTSVSVLFP